MDAALDQGGFTMQRLDNSNSDVLIFRERWCKPMRLVALAFLGLILAGFLAAVVHIIKEAVLHGHSPWAALLGLGIGAVFGFGILIGKLGTDLIQPRCIFDRRSREATAQDTLFGLVCSHRTVSVGAHHGLWIFDGAVWVPRILGGRIILFLDATLYLCVEGEELFLLAKGNRAEIVTMAEAAAALLDLDLIEATSEHPRLVRASQKTQMAELLKQSTSPRNATAKSAAAQSVDPAAAPDDPGREPVQSGRGDGESFDWSDLSN
jgi:hypothetical protein